MTDNALIDLLAQAGADHDEQCLRRDRYDAIRPTVAVTDALEAVIAQAAAHLGVNSYELRRELQARRFAGDDWQAAVRHAFDRWGG